MPWTTTALVDSVAYDRQLPGDSPYRAFAATLESFDRDPNKFPFWGYYAPADVLHDGDGDSLPRTKIHRIGEGKLALKVVDGLMMYTAAASLFDKITREYGDTSKQQDVLKHPKQRYWIGQSKVLTELDDVVAMVSLCLGSPNDPVRYLATEDAHYDGDGVVRLANEIAAVHGSMRQMSAIRNIGIVALNITVMMKGYLQVPDNVSAIGLDPNLATNSNLKKLLSKPRRLRIALLLAMAITPLVVFLEDDITKHTVCVEEVLWNFKRLGNDKPLELVTMEDDTMREIFLVAEGKQSATKAFSTLRTRWLEGRLLEKMGKASRFFFNRPGVVLYRPELSLYGALPSQPYPDRWPLPPLALAAIDTARRAAPDEEIGSEPPAESPSPPFIPPAHSRTPQPAEPADAPSTEVSCAKPSQKKGVGSRSKGRVASSKTQRKGKRKRNPATPSPKQPSRGTPRRSTRHTVGKKIRALRGRRGIKSRSVVSDEGESEDVHDSAESDIEILEYHEFKGKDETEREVVKRDLVVKLEENDGLGVAFMNGAYVKPRVTVGDSTTRFSDTQARIMHVWDASGRLHEVKPSIHLEEDYHAWMRAYDAYQSALVVGKDGARMPAFVEDPANSLFAIARHSEYLSQSERQVHSAMSGRSIVLTESPGPHVSFDKKGIETVDVLSHRTELQGDLRASYTMKGH